MAAAQRLEHDLARELCTHIPPCGDCIAAARLVLANPAVVGRFLARVAHDVTKTPHRLGPTALGAR